MKKSFLLLFFVAILIVPIHVATAQEASVNPNGTVDDRLNKAVNEQRLSLDDASKANIVLKCQNSQVVLNEIQRTTDSLIRKRIDIYSGLQKDVIAIQLRMVRQGSDASEIDLLTGRIQQGLDSFTLAADSYGTTLNDIILINCVDKPQQFQAGLIMMRLKRAKVLSTATELKNIMLSAPLTTYEPLKKRMVF